MVKGRENNKKKNPKKRRGFMKKTIISLFILLALQLFVPAIILAQADSIVVNFPGSGENINTASTYSIVWSTVGTIPDVKIEYSLDGGTSWNVIAYTTSNTGSYSWSVPYTTSFNCLIRVSDVDGSPVGVSGTFSIVDDGVPRIRVTSPNGGETLTALSTHTITWETTGILVFPGVENIKIEYSTDDGDTWVEVVASTENDGSYDWTVPNSPSTECRVRVSEFDGDPVDSSDSLFEIVGAGTDSLNLTFPNGGETLPGGQTQTITWTSTGSISNVKIEYSTDNGTSWKIITSATGNDGSYVWQVPSIESNECLVRISDALDGSPSEQSAGIFSIVLAGTETINVTNPNGSNNFLIGTTDEITWTSTGTIDNVRIQYSTNNGSSWTEIIDSTTNDGSYYWLIPNTPSTQCLVRISDAADGTPADTSDSVFTIMYPQPGISIGSPSGGESWEVGKQHDITWITSGTVGNVKIEYSTNNKSTWNTITNSTANDGSYTWTIPNAPSSDCYIRISEAADGDPTATNMNPFSIISGPEDAEISINRTTLYFASMKLHTVKTPDQKIIVDNNSDVATLRWGAAVNDEATWLRIDTVSGLNSGMITVSVHTRWMEVGTYTGTITISADEATTSPQTVNVTLTVYPSQGDSAPFGSFETPQDGSTVMSSIPVSGWVLDDIGVDEVTIYRSAVPAEGDGMVYVGDAVLVDGARPDVEQLYPTYPASYKAGWGYMMLTNFLPNGGNGTFTLYAYAEDETDHEVLLGSKTITCDNANAVKPFGAIDTPEQGGEASGSSSRNNGWVLTPMPNKIPGNGSTILVYIDGVLLGNVNYGYYREDIASLFPGYANSNAAHGYFDIDTTAYSNGLHTIQWTAADNAGNSDGIGSRYFVTIQNPGYNRTASVSTSKKRFRSLSQLVMVPVDRANTVGLKTGYRKGVKPHRADVDYDGTVQVTLKQDNRLELHLFQGKGYRNCDGYMVVGEQLRMLPAGSTLDRKRGIFYWHAGTGFFGEYELMFVVEDVSGKITKRPVKVSIVSKY
jgi:hypothetical protein